MNDRSMVFYLSGNEQDVLSRHLKIRILSPELNKPGKARLVFAPAPRRYSAILYRVRPCPLVNFGANFTL